MGPHGVGLKGSPTLKGGLMVVAGGGPVRGLR